MAVVRNSSKNGLHVPKGGHQPTRGARIEVFMAVLANGQKTDPLEQVLITGFGGKVTVVTAAAGTYTVTIGTTDYSYVAIASNSKYQIMKGLMDVINAGTDASAINPDYYNYTFAVVSNATFVLDQTSPSTDSCLAVTAVTGGASPSKGANTINLAFPLLGDIQEGQYLTFADANDVEKLVRLSTKALAGDSVILVEPLPEAITPSAAEYPPYLWDRTNADLTRTYNNQATTTFNTGGEMDGVLTTKEKTFSCNGIYYHYNAAYKTAIEATEEGKFIWVKRQLPPPNDAYKSGEAVYGRAVITSAPQTGGAENYIEGNIEGKFMGPVTRLEAVPV